MRFGFYSGRSGSPWSWAEEMWSLTALTLIERGHDVGVCYQWWPEGLHRLDDIREHGGTVFWRDPPAPLHRYERLLRYFRTRPTEVDAFSDWCDRFAPDFIHFKDGRKLIGNAAVIRACRARRIPYVINLRGLDQNTWLADAQRAEFREAFLGAASVCVLSQDNAEILETLLGAPVPQARVIDNVFAALPSDRPSWPGDREPWRIACVGSLDFQHKGQDLILKMLAHERWHDRPLQVSFWGRDKGSRRHMLDLIEMYGIRDKVDFGGFCNDISQVWAQHHALLLPSRFEGNSRAVMEAIACGRVPIVTKVGRNAEVVDDDETGFLVSAPSVELLDAAMERAWSRRHEWQVMGELGAARMRQNYSMTPVADYATVLEEVAARS